MIYFDNAATTLKKPASVAQAVFDAIRSETLSNPGRGAHRTSHDASILVFKTQEALASLLDGEDYALALTKNATEALNIALLGMFEPGDHIITTASEHNSVLRPIYHLETMGIDHSIVPIDPETGTLHIEYIEGLIRPNTKAIVVNHGSNVTGNVCNIAAINAIVKGYQLRLIVDGSQTAGAFPLSIKDMDPDVFCFTGHKSLYGPQGTGGLFIKKDLSIRPLMTGGSGSQTFSPDMPSLLPDKLHAGTENVHGLAGLLAACQWLKEKEIVTIYDHNARLATRMIDELKTMKHITLYGDFERPRVATFGFNIRDAESGTIAFELDRRFGIAVRPGAHCAPLVHRTFNTIDQGMVRISLSSFNTEAEIDEGLLAIETLCRDYEKGLLY